MGPVQMRVKRLPHGKTLPKYATSGSAGLDLCAAISEPLKLEAHARTKIPTGFIVEIPEGFEGQVVPRSGLAAKAGISLTNCVGTIDSDYRGELQVLLINHSDDSYLFEPGERIAQLVLVPIPKIEVIEVDDLGELTQRGEGGFGSTGKTSA